MFEQTFKNIDDILHKDVGCGSELDYVEPDVLVLFLKYLDDLKKNKATAAELINKLKPIIYLLWSLKEKLFRFMN
jgi:type I restriction enzyme M protein